MEVLSMFGLTGFWVYVLIFCGKMIEVTCGTMRIMLVNKGKKFLGVLFGIMEITLWVFIASTVISDMYSDPMKMVVYCAAFAVGILIGMYVEQKLAIGLTSIQIVSLKNDGQKIGELLRDNGFGVTILDGHSVDGTKRELVFVQLKRKNVAQATELVQQISPEAVISVSDIKTVRGGFIK